MYIIQSIEIQEEAKFNEDGNSQNELAFNLSLFTYFNKNGIPYEELPFMNLKYKNVSSHPFKPKIHEPEIDEEELFYVDIDKAKILGLTKKNIMIEDSKGNVSFLSVGDKVAYGYLQKINWEDQFALFNVNRIGVPLEKKLYVNIDNEGVPTGRKINFERK